MNTAKILFHDDVQVGQAFSTASYQLQQAEIQSFAAHHDPQPFHLDPEQAKHTLFGGLAASGWQTAAITMKLMVEGGLPLAGGIIGAGCELSWPAPTRPGDILHVEGEVVAVKPATPGRKRGMVTMRAETKNQDGTVVQIMAATLVVQRRPESSDQV
jgi:acyl dehydratase